MSIWKRSWPAWTAIAVGAVLLAAGLWRGEHEVVLRKAVRICMECIGLG